MFMIKYTNYQLDNIWPGWYDEADDLLLIQLFCVLFLKAIILVNSNLKVEFNEVLEYC